jgi:hypothetical protein
MDRLILASAANWSIGYYYKIRWKGHLETNWHEIFFASNGCLFRDSGSKHVVFSPERTAQVEV